MSSNPPTTPTLHTLSVLGVRDFKNKLYKNTDYVSRTMDKHIAMLDLTYADVAVVTGGAGGVERMVVDWCEAHDVPCRTIPPNIEQHGHYRAFMIRNNHVVSDGDELIAFWDGCIELTTQAFINAAFQQRKTTIYPLI
jgi:hypothetical protein